MQWNRTTHIINIFVTGTGSIVLNIAIDYVLIIFISKRLVNQLLCSTFFLLQNGKDHLPALPLSMALCLFYVGGLGSWYHM